MKLNLFIIIIVALPILASIVAGFLGRKIGIKGSQFITCFSLLISSSLISYAFYEIVLCGGEAVNLNLGSWVDSGLLTINWEFKFDNLSISLGLAVLFCSTLIHIYSISYLESDPAKYFGKTFMWVKLPNSGNILKLLIPNYIRKIISGQNNYLGRVTSQKMSENKMDNRGSKSKVLNTFVKEQRVDGSYCFNNKLSLLRCTLMGFERNYQIKIPSKQSNIKNLSNINRPQINPWFWTGLIDAEGSFSIIVDRKENRKLGWRVEPKFQLGLHTRDTDLLLQLQTYWGGIGNIYPNSKRDVVNYMISSKNDLITLINHFDNYPLLSQKLADYLLFKKVVIMIMNKDHLTIEGLLQIINIKASMNLGLSELLKSEFQNYIPIDRPFINTENIPALRTNWISGFVTGDGNFDVKISPSNQKIGYRIQLRFRISQHIRDLKLLKLIIKYLNTGSIYKYRNKPAISLVIFNNSDIINKIIPFFNQNSLLATKLLDYKDWCEVANLIKIDSHLTLEGLKLIRSIKLRMNRGRDNI
jgi:LAGLIDADG endonuclease/NADH-Ubiquinone oxidoreductase (complex I), chain 5 N-terminus